MSPVLVDFDMNCVAVIIVASRDKLARELALFRPSCQGFFITCNPVCNFHSCTQSPVSYFTFTFHFSFISRFEYRSVFLCSPSCGKHYAFRHWWSW